MFDSVTNLFSGNDNKTNDKNTMEENEVESGLFGWFDKIRNYFSGQIKNQQATLIIWRIRR